ncbi:TPA: DUF6287 domain-containing protein [Streptococcus suis]
MKKSMLLTSLLLSSVLLLGGCNQSQSSSTATSASNSSSQSVSASSTESSSTSASSGNAEQTTEKSGEQVNSSNSGETGTETQTNVTATPSTAISNSSIAVEAISNGDYSSISGTWVDQNGKTLTIENDGKARFSESTEDSILSVQSVKNQVIHADIATGPYSAAMKIIPAGVEDPYYATVENVDRIAIGHGIDMYDHPFYRQ